MKMKAPTLIIIWSIYCGVSISESSTPSQSIHSNSSGIPVSSSLLMSSYASTTQTSPVKTIASSEIYIVLATKSVDGTTPSLNQETIEASFTSQTSSNIGTTVSSYISSNIGMVNNSITSAVSATSSTNAIHPTPTPTVVPTVSKSPTYISLETSISPADISLETSTSPTDTSLETSISPTGISLKSPTHIPLETSMLPTETIGKSFIMSDFQSSYAALKSNVPNVSSSVEHSQFLFATYISNVSSDISVLMSSISDHISSNSVNTSSTAFIVQSSSSQLSEISTSLGSIPTDLTQSIEILPISRTGVFNSSSYPLSTTDRQSPESEKIFLSTVTATDVTTRFDITASVTDIYHFDSPSSKPLSASLFVSDNLSTSSAFSIDISSTMPVDYTTGNTTVLSITPSTVLFVSSDLNLFTTLPMVSSSISPSAETETLPLNSSYELSTYEPMPPSSMTTMILASAQTPSSITVPTTYILNDYSTSIGITSSIYHSTSSYDSTKTTAVLRTSTDFVQISSNPTAVTKVDTTSYTEPTTSHSPTVKSQLESFTVLITFKDECNNLRTTARLQLDFFEALVDELIATVGFRISKDNIQFKNFRCDPLSVGIVLRNVSSAKVLESITDSIHNSSFVVPVMDNGRIIRFRGNEAKLTEDEVKKDPRLSDTAIEQRDIIIISTASFLFMVLLFFGSVIVCRECYLRKRAASFNLLDVPHVELKLTDFTLTKIPRPHLSYVEPPPSRLYQHVCTDQQYDNFLPGHAVHGNRKLAVDAENIHVRMHDHDDGLVVGITCTPPPSPVQESASSSSSPFSESVDPCRQKLLKVDNNKVCERGNINPIYATNDIRGDQRHGVMENDENIEQMV